MNIQEKEQLFRLGDASPDAIQRRLIAARESVGMKQIDIAKAVGVGKTTYNSQEIKGSPAIKVVKYLYGAHRIDFNFVYHGDFAQLPIDVQSRLEVALCAPRKKMNCPER
jgi:DNA-binding XRE family transcriptional regulator